MGSPPVVLIIEDDGVVREVLAAAFEKAGMTVIAVASRDAGIRAARKQPPDVAVVDRQLPDGDGWKAVAELRRAAGAQHEVAVIAITAHVGLSNAERALVAGCDVFLEKPCNPRVVVEHALDLLETPRASATTGVKRRKVRDTAAHRQARARK